MVKVKWEMGNGKWEWKWEWKWEMVNLCPYLGC